MGVSPALLFRLLAVSLLVGAAMGVLYDVLRIGRVMLGMSRYTAAASAPLFCPKFYRPRGKKGDKRVFRIFKQVLLIVQDFLFCLAVGSAIALLLFSRNNGEFRGFVFLGLIIGFVAYYFTVGQLVIRASEYVVFAIKTLFLYAAYYLTLPFITFFRFAITHIGGAIRRYREKRREKKIRHYTKAKQQTLTLAAQKGFLEVIPPQK